MYEASADERCSPGERLQFAVPRCAIPWQNARQRAQSAYSRGKSLTAQLSGMKNDY